MLKTYLIASLSGAPEHLWPAIAEELDVDLENPRLEIDCDGVMFLIIVHNDKVVGVYSDRGEPEDNRFVRDWRWVSVEIEKAYERGRCDVMQATQNLANIS